MFKTKFMFCRKPFNEHSYHARFQFAKWYQRRRLKSKSLQTTDAKGEQYVTRPLYSSFYLTWLLQTSSELCTRFVSHNWMTLFREWGYSPQKEGHLGVWQLWMKNIKVDITEILLKVAVNTITPPIWPPLF
jgi:hypothetical protein